VGNDQAKSSWITALLFTIAGAVLGAGGQYLSSIDQQRLELLRASRRDAYVQFLNAQVLSNLAHDPEKYQTETTEARKKIAIYGNKAVAIALAKYWREYFPDLVCGGPPEKDSADVAIYQSMRKDIMPRGEDISDSDMMLLVNFCRLPVAKN
jgi:hypothetical protein